jgi:integrase/recombinase XerD
VLTGAVEAYLALRQACGFKLIHPGRFLRSFATFSEARDQRHVCAATAIEWAGLSPSLYERARRLGAVIRFTRHLRAEDSRHELPPAVYGSERPPRAVPYVLSLENVQRLVAAAAQCGSRTLRQDTYSTLFSLLSCTGLRVSEAIRLRYADITPDGLVIRESKFRKSRLVPLHETARAGVERYLERRRPYAPLDDHVFISLRRNPLGLQDVERAFKSAATKIGLPRDRRRPRPTPRSLRHYFAVKSLETCPDGRDRIAHHMMALSTFLGHSSIEHTFWYLHATPELMTDIAERSENFFKEISHDSHRPPYHGLSPRAPAKGT